MDIKSFVDRIFTDSQSITLEEKSQFGQSVRSPESRLLFAQFVDDYRVNSKRVSELTFYSLAQYFSIVLLECLLAEDFRPAKIIMNMMFTYYYEQNSAKVSPIHDTQKTSKSSITPPTQHHQQSHTKQPFTNIYKWKKRNNYETSSGSSSSNSVDINDDANINNSEQQQLVKIYLYTLLKDQEIFKSIRFWTSAFYESVIIERKNHPVFVNRENGKLSEEKRIEESDCSKNITFGLLGSFIYNMSLLDLSHEFCQEFLDKHSAIAGLSGDQLDMLRTNMETMFGKTSLST